jgi:serine/threonine protein kinase
MESRLLRFSKICIGSKGPISHLKVNAKMQMEQIDHDVVFIKTDNRTNSDDKGIQQNSLCFQQEQKILKRLGAFNIQSIAKCYGEGLFDIDGGLRKFLCLEYADHDVDWTYFTAFNTTELIQFAIGILIPLNALHAQNVIHCSIRPEHILFEPFTHNLTLIGFRGAIFLDDESDESQTLAQGLKSQEYGRNLIPDTCITTKADSWGLGVVLYMAIMRCSPNSFQKVNKILCNNAETSKKSWHPPQIAETPTISTAIFNKYIAQDEEILRPDCNALVSLIKGLLHPDHQARLSCQEAMQLLHQNQSKIDPPIFDRSPDNIFIPGYYNPYANTWIWPCLVFKREFPPLEPGKPITHGYGVKATLELPIGACVASYVTWPITLREADRRNNTGQGSHLRASHLDHTVMDGRRDWGIYTVDLFAREKQVLLWCCYMCPTVLCFTYHCNVLSNDSNHHY